MNVHNLNIDFNSVQPIKSNVNIKQFEYGNDCIEFSLLKNGAIWKPESEFSKATIKITAPDGIFSERVLWKKDDEEKNALSVTDDSTVLSYNIDIFEVYKAGEVNLQICFYAFDDTGKISRKALSPIIYFEVFKSLSSFNLMSRKAIDLIDELINNVTALNVTVNYEEYVQKLMKAVSDIANLSSGKVDKEEGKGLSANDYTNEEKEKLHNLDSDFKEAKQNLENRITQANDDIASMGVLIEENKGEESYNPESSKSQSGKAVAEAIAGIVNSAPETLNTLEELAKALGNDPNFATSIMSLLGKKVDKIEGKVLSSNDFTDEEKEILFNLLEQYETIARELGTSVYPAIDGKVDKAEGYGLTLMEPTPDPELDDEYTWDRVYFENKAYIEGEEDVIRYVEIYSVDGIKKLLYPKPQSKIPAVLKPNTQYNFGETASLSLAFPTVANDGDVIYATFITGETATSLTVDTTNTCDIELIPEKNTGYEIFGKFNGSIWIVNYSEYTVSEV